MWNTTLGTTDWERIKARLKPGSSPKEIAGREKLEGGPGGSATWIYKWLREERASGGQLYLRRQGRRRKARAKAGEAGAG